MPLSTTEDTEQEIQSAFSNELSQLVEQEGDDDVLFLFVCSNMKDRMSLAIVFLLS